MKPKACCGCGEQKKLSMHNLCAQCEWVLAMKGETVELAQKNYDQAMHIASLNEQIRECSKKLKGMVPREQLTASMAEQKHMVSRNVKMRHQWYETKAKLNNERSALVKAFRKIKELEVV